MSSENQYTRDSVKGHLLADVDELLRIGQAGDWAFDETGSGVIAICINLPDGTTKGAFVRLLLAPIDSVQEWWEWDGVREAPTIAPSINRLPNWNRAGWHGWMRQGELISA